MKNRSEDGKWDEFLGDIGFVIAIVLAVIAGFLFSRELYLPAIIVWIGANFCVVISWRFRPQGEQGERGKKNVGE